MVIILLLYDSLIADNEALISEGWCAESSINNVPLSKECFISSRLFTPLYFFNPFFIISTLISKSNAIEIAAKLFWILCFPGTDKLILSWKDSSIYNEKVDSNSE